MKCPYCNQEHEEDTIYCPRTGKKIENSMKACGNPNCPMFGMYILSPDSEFCPKCGKPITALKKITSSEAEGSTDESNRPSESFSSPYVYDEIYDFHEGLAQVRRNEREGFIDITGEEIIPCIYEELSYPENGLMVAKFRGKHIIINTKNKLVFANGVDVSEWEEANSYYVD